MSYRDHIPPLIKLMRPRQWAKNGFCLLGVVFGHKLFDPNAVMNAVSAAIIFSAASSAVYIMNDIHDVEQDRKHPKKRWRPLPRGQVSMAAALVLAISLAAFAVFTGYFLGPGFWICLLSFMALNFAYSALLKHFVLLDVMCIALGFMLRLLGGIFAADLLPTAWITLCTLFLALFLGFCKRRAELIDVKEGSSKQQRPVLERYTVPLLDALVNSTATMAVMTYALFAVMGRNPTLVLTVPIVQYAVMRYKFLLLVAQGAEEPEKVLLRDPVIFGCVFLWLASYVAIYYGKIQLFQ